ncbi:hypothetical protein TetV_388 [Tetraselmis virus 1]|uniref:Uncharacterized protein n=1 Tax=Tetraselmis virus 1 TaxID=2060617 RepID=A0A2P0VNN5_9VIRU|nr:hypothetical protein QJ968_gp388 [Tetraselmis virus 1]AUF82480.1 hypothetical protein TetV_388 [Tetraselmis virus 1]
MFVYMLNAKASIFNKQHRLKETNLGIIKGQVDNIVGTNFVEISLKETGLEQTFFDTPDNVINLEVNSSFYGGKCVFTNSVFYFQNSHTCFPSLHIRKEHLFYWKRLEWAAKILQRRWRNKLRFHVFLFTNFGDGLSIDITNRINQRIR